MEPAISVCRYACLSLPPSTHSARETRHQSRSLFTTNHMCAIYNRCIAARKINSGRKCRDHHCFNVSESNPGSSLGMRGNFEEPDAIGRGRCMDKAVQHHDAAEHLVHCRAAGLRDRTYPMRSEHKLAAAHVASLAVSTFTSSWRLTFIQST
jgi:hypothetical protein